MTDLEKVSKLIGKLQYFIEQLDNTSSLQLHQEVNQFYYMQKSGDSALPDHFFSRHAKIITL